MRFKLTCILALLLTACGEQGVTAVAVLPVQGAAIDGSEDLVPVPEPDLPPPVEVVAVAFEQTAEQAPEPAPEPEPEPEPEPPAGPLAITYRDLSLIDYDVDAMLDAMLFPEEYEDEEDDELEFPPELQALDGREVSIVGYMIPGEMEQGNVRDFMLVRDLLGCCFGGTPMPDEWIDVVMEEDAEAKYRPYLPMRVIGVMTLGGQQDEAGFALGVYQLKGSHVAVED